MADSSTLSTDTNLKNNLKPSDWIGRINRTTKLQKDKRQEALRYKRGYTGDFRDKNGMKQSKQTINVNFIYNLIETVMPSLFAGDPEIIIEPKWNPALDQAAELLQYVVNYWAKETGAREELKDAIFDNFFGPSAIYTGWEFETAKQTTTDPITGEETESDVVTKDRPIIRWVDFWDDVRSDPDVKRGRHARWMALRVTIPYDDFQELADVPDDFKQGGKFEIKPNIRPEDEDKDKSNNPNKRVTEGEVSDAEWVTYWEVWDKQRHLKLWVHEESKQYLNKTQEWPYDFIYEGDEFPISIFDAKIDSESPVTFSELKPIEDQIWERTRNRSMQMAIIKRFAPKLIGKRNVGTNTQINKFLNSDPLSFNELSNPEGLMLAPVPEVPAEFWTWDGVLNNDLGNISGLSDFTNGQIANTATEASIAQGRQNVRKTFRSQELERFVAKVLGKVAMLVQQLQDRAVTIAIAPAQDSQAEPEVFHVTKEQIQGDFKFNVFPGSMLHQNEVLKIQEMTRFLEVAQNSPEVNQRQLIMELAKLHKVNPNTILKSPQQKQMEAQAQQQSAAALEAAKDRIQFKPIDIKEIASPVDQMSVVTAAMAQNHVPPLPVAPLQQAQGQMSQINQMQGGAPQAPQAPMQQTPNHTPMNASQNMAGNANPAVPVHPNSMTGKR